jgi:competence protein ComEC
MFDKAFRKTPFMRVLIPVTGGIIMASLTPVPGIITWILAGFLLFLLLLLIILPDRVSGPLRPFSGPRNAWLAGIFQALFLCMGGIMGREGDVALIPASMLQARICDEILEGEKTFKTSLDRVYYLSGEKWTRLEGRVQVYFEKENRCADLEAGDCISGWGKLLSYEDPVNPFEFNYGDYQRSRGLCYHLFLDSASWIPSPAYARRGWQMRSKGIRHILMDRIDRSIKGRDEKAILCSLLLGYRAELGQDVKQQFIRSGSMHILAVSGLHVGILYILPALLIGKIRSSVAGRLLATLVLLSLLWSYAMLTGLSPSVVRAVTMCSVHSIAKLTGRKAGIFHVLSLTAFIMVLSRPAIIFDAGFQLSFAAVAGIAGFQKPLYNMIPVKGWLARKAWQLMTVSLAAQLATAPLSLFYFHQFSHVFLVSNLIVIPLATLILYMGLAFILLSSLGLYPFSGVLEWLASLLSWITHLMGRIPGAFSENISLVPAEVILYYLMIILCGLFFRFRRVVLLHAVMVVFVMLMMVSGIREYRIRSHEACYIFAIPQESAISFVQGRNHAMYRGGRVSVDTLNMPYALLNFSVRQKLSTPVYLPGPIPGEQHILPGLAYISIDTADMQLLFAIFKDRRMVILRKMSSFPSGTDGLETDILVLVDNVPCNLDSLIHVFRPGMVIVDGSSYSRFHEEAERACIRHGIPVHSTEKDGFYVY